MEIEKSVNKYLKQVYFRIQKIGDCSGSGGDSSSRSNKICTNYVKKEHIQRFFDSKGHDSSNNQSNKSRNELPE